MRLSKNFTLAEFTKSQTATRKGLDNTPGAEHLESAKALFENVVQKVRDNFGVTVINSGYRGPALNEAVGGSSKSQHCKGEAVDIECPGTGNYDVAKWISENCDFDQDFALNITKTMTSTGVFALNIRKTMISTGTLL